MNARNRTDEPPRRQNAEGETRRVGVEIEFAAVTAKSGAEVVQNMFGGDVEEEDPHRFHVKNTEMGDFVCELDTQFAHDMEGSDNADSGESPAILSKFRVEMRKFVGDVSGVVVPCEIVCPPISYTQIALLDDLVERLSDIGAEGTRSSPFYAFGAQLNPEIASRDADYLVATLKAYVLLSPWLREVMNIDITRRLLTFADPFPRNYVEKIVSSDYWPDETAFMEDYLAANPTRNRELDLLPLLSWLDDDLLRRFVDDNRVRSRPTFHYRLPDANFGDERWSISLEWNRWLIVERLAEDRELLQSMGAEYLRLARSGSRDQWPLQASQCLLLS